LALLYTEQLLVVRLPQVVISVCISLLDNLISLPSWVLLFMFLILFERQLLTVDLTRGRRFAIFEIATMPLFVVLFVCGEWSVAALKHGDATGLEDGLLTLTFVFELATLLFIGIGVVLAPAMRGRFTVRTGGPLGGR
jgi:hypothetical protein